MLPTTRGQQRRQTGDPFGPLFSSPVRKRDKKKTTTIVPSFMGMHERRKMEMESRLARFRQKRKASLPEEMVVVEQEEEEVFSLGNGDISSDGMNIDTPLEDERNTSVDYSLDAEMPNYYEDIQQKPRRIVPDGKAISLYERWINLLPSLVDPLLNYMSVSNGQALPGVSATGFRGMCQRPGFCVPRTAKMLCLFLDHHARLEIPFCDCQNLHTVLICHGLFPSSPVSPRVAFAIHLLDFYRSLFERSCDATNALATSLVSFYGDRGYAMLNNKGHPTSDPIRRSLAPAMQWYDNLRGMIDRNLEQALVEADRRLCSIQAPKLSSTPNLQGTLEPPERSPSTSAPLLPSHASLEPEECARILQQRCPACFGGSVFGRSFERGGDIHVGVDGNFNHRHLRKAGECPQFYTPEFILPKAMVDAVGLHIEELRGKPAKKRTPIVPDEAIDDCQASHTAGSGSNQKTNLDRYDDGGLMALVCRHDIPLFAANIDTPGEQQKYAVTLIQHLFSFLPPTATVAVLYDVGCVLDRSLCLYDFLPESVVSRMLLATSAMHAYAHQWACQLVYNPRLREGLGLTDGEGVERLWSRMRKLIGVTRGCSRSRRIWLLDRQLAFIATDLRSDLGAWNHRKRKALGKFRKAADENLSKVQIPVVTLREEWTHQRQAQLSIRAHAPARLKKELDSVLELQAEFDKVGKSLRSAEELLGQFSGSQKLLKTLRKRSNRIIEKTDQLLSSLNVQHDFPELKGLDIEFVRLLLLARDLKINIRKRSVGSFFEMDRLDQAVAGRDQAIGTRMHQSTRGTINKRSPALKNAISTYNKYCARMASLYQPGWDIPVPEPLPTKLTELRNCSHLWEDVWIQRSDTGDIPRWLDDEESV